MKVSIRQNVFETNSSSVHSICISKKPIKEITKGEIHFFLGEFGWEFDKVNKYDYLYTAIMLSDKHETYMNKLRAVLEEYNVKYIFERPRYSGSGDYAYLDNGSIDHSWDTEEFLEAIFSDVDMLLRYLFNDDSAVYTGNDNSDGFWRYETAYQGFRTAYDDNDKCISNPFHNEKKFDYFIKGN